MKEKPNGKTRGQLAVRCSAWFGDLRSIRKHLTAKIEAQKEIICEIEKELWIATGQLKEMEWMMQELETPKLPAPNPDEKLPDDISTCDDCGAPMPIAYEGDGGSTYCAKCAGVESPNNRFGG